MLYTLSIEEENKEIVKRYRDLLKHAKPYLKEGDTKVIKKAFSTAMEAHKEMRRKSGEPYIFHPIAVAQIAVEEIGLGTTSIVAALLHDVVEDTEITLEDIEKGFGKKVAQIIDGLTKISGGFNIESQQAENFRKMVITLSDDVRVVLVKLADRLHNMRTLGSMPRHKQLKIASETIYFYAPLAHRLGLYSIKTELEDLYLKYTEPEKYKEIEQKLEETALERSRLIRDFIRPIQLKLRDLHFEFKIKGRPKSIYSIWKKMTEQQIPFEQVYDLFAIRIIVDANLDEEKSFCWHVYSIITDFYKPSPDRLRDWISTPKSNGYESLHTTVMSDVGRWVEVQIRTSRMDEIAERGYAAHWKYKDKDKSKKEEIGEEKSGLDEWIDKIRDLLVQQQGNSSAIEFVNDFRTNLFNKEIFVFTPKGDLKVLPVGATVLDFAFEIHTQVGTHCLGAKINHKIVPMNYELKNGDQVDILTSDKEQVTKDWFEYVMTAKARKRIKDFLHEVRRKIALEGKELATQKLQELGLDFDKYNRKDLLAFLKYHSLTEFYYQVGLGNIPFTIFDDLKKNGVLNISKLGNSAVVEEENLEEPVTESAKKALLIGENQEEVEYLLASCCNPIAGDDVFGYITINGEVEVHRTNCTNATELMANYGYRIVKAKWNDALPQSFEVTIQVVATDRKGMISDISSTISNMEVNIVSMKADTETGIVYDTFKVQITNSKLLDDLIRNLKNIPQVMTVERMN